MTTAVRQTRPGRVRADWERCLGGAPAHGVFGDVEMAGLPEPVRRHLRMAICPGSVLTRAVSLTMRGTIKVGRWLPFRAWQVLDPHAGYIWAARAAGLIVGSDCYLDGEGAMDWRLAGLVTVVHADGPDVSRSAAGRAGVEGLLVPSAMLPRFGVTWSAADDAHISVRHMVGRTPVEVAYALGPDARIQSLVFDRWGDPDGTGVFDWHPFGGEITGYRTFDGLTVPSAGRLGWNFGTDRWAEGEFFRFEITQLRRLGPDRGSVST